MTERQLYRNRIRKKIPKGRRAWVQSQDQYACVFCGSRGPLSMDHVVPVQDCLDQGYCRYTINHPINLVTACFLCNTVRVHDQPKVMRYGRFSANPTRFDRYLKLTRLAMKALEESLAAQGEHYANTHERRSDR